MEKRFKKPSGWKWAQFKNNRGGMLRFGCLQENKKPTAHILYVEGLSEYAEKTFEISSFFKKNNCNFWVVDRHGIGKSSRILQDMFKQHSTGLHHDVDDLQNFAKNIIPGDAPVILLGHSTGGLIALLAQHDHPDLFAGAILTAPLLGIKNDLIENREIAFARTPIPDCTLQKYISDGGPWKPRSSPENDLKPEDFTSDPVRNKIQDSWQKSDPKLRIGSPTYGWVHKICKAIAKTRNVSYLNETGGPILMFTAGNDKLVNNKYSFNAAANMPNSTLIHFKNGKHELLMETDDIRDPLLKKSIQFIQKIAKKPS